MVVTRRRAREAACKGSLDALLIFIEAAPAKSLTNIKTLRLVSTAARTTVDRRVKLINIAPGTHGDPTKFEQHLRQMLQHIRKFSLSDHDGKYYYTSPRPVLDMDFNPYLSAISTHCGLNLQSLKLHILNADRWASTAALDRVERWPRLTDLDITLDFEPDEDFSAAFLSNMTVLDCLTLSHIRTPLQLTTLADALGNTRSRLLTFTLKVQFGLAPELECFSALKYVFNGFDNLVNLDFDGSDPDTLSMDFLASIELKTLKDLTLKRGILSFESITKLSEGLQYLATEDCTLSGFSSLTSANFLQLEDIFAEGCDAEDANWSDLAKLDFPNLSGLVFSNCYDFKETDLRYIAEAMPKLPKVAFVLACANSLEGPSFSFVPFDGKQVLENFFSGSYVMQSLTRLDFAYCHFSADALELLCFKYAARCPNLVELILPLRGAPAVAMLVAAGKQGAWPNLSMLTAEDISQGCMEDYENFESDDDDEEEEEGERVVDEYLQMRSSAARAAIKEAWPGIKIKLKGNGYFR